MKFLIILLFLFLIPNYPAKLFQSRRDPAGVIKMIQQDQLPITDYGLFAQDTKEEEAFFVAKKAFADGFYDVSLSLLERFLKNYPASKHTAEANLLIGRCYFQQSKFLDALAKFEELAKQEGANPLKDALYYWIAEVHFKGNNFTKAGQYYQKVIEDFPQSVYACASFYSLGWCLFQEGNFGEAIKYFQMVKEKFPKEPQAQDSSFKSIEASYNLKDYATLEEKINSYLKNYPKDSIRLPHLYFYLAEAHYYLNNFSPALLAYAKVISATTDEKIKALSKLGLAWAHLKLKQYAQAEEVLEEVSRENLDQRNREILLLAKGILLAETKRYGQAKEIYTQLMESASDTLTLLQAYLGKADTFYHTAEYRQAIEIYKAALEKKLTQNLPVEMTDKLHYELAWAYLKEGEFKEAIAEFQKVAKSSEDKIVKISALCQIGDTYQDAGNYEKAQEAYDKILKDYPDSFYSDYVQYRLGVSLLKSANYDGAVLAFLSFQKNYPDSKLADDATYALGLAYFQKEDYHSSAQIFQDFIQGNREGNLRPQGMYLLGTSLYNLEKYTEAIAAFEEIVRSYSWDTELVQKAEYEIADCYAQLGNEKEAMARFQMLRSKYPDSSLTAEVLWWLGEYYYRHNDLTLARRYFNSLINEFSKSSLLPDAYYILGSTYAEEAKYPEAIANFQKVVSFGRSELAGTAAIAIADISLRQQDYDLALRTCKEVLNNYPNLTYLIYPKMAEIYTKSQDYTQALDFYRQSLEVVPVKEMSSVQFKIAEVLQAEGKTTEAVAEYLKVTYLYSEDNALSLKALLRVAAIYENQENFSEALNIYKRIVGMNVEESKYAQERIDWIKGQLKR